MPKRYRIGDAAKLIGVTPELIRYYESRGIIAPVRDPQSGYRYYGTWDIHMLTRARALRQFGFSLEESANIMAQETDEASLSLMTDMEEKLEEEIRRKMLLLKRIRENDGHLKEAIDGIGKYKLVTRPAFLRLHMQTGYVLEENDEAQMLMRRWMNEAAFVTPSALFTVDDYKNRSQEFSFGLVIEEKYADILGNRDSKYIKSYPETPCIYTAFPSRDSKYLNWSYLDAAMEYIEKQGLQLAGDIITRVVVMRRPGKEYFNCHQVWIPIR